MVVKRAGEPAAERHPRHAGKQQGRHPPRRLGRREQLADRHDIGRNDAAEAEPVGGRNREQPGLVPGHREGGDRQRLAGRAGQHRAKPADAVGEPAPELPADKGAAEQHRQHRRALRRRDAEIAAKRDQMADRHRHRHAAQESPPRTAAPARVFGRKPSACVPRTSEWRRACGAPGCGAGRRSNAIGTITATTTTA